MTSEQRRRVRDVFEASLDRPSPERIRWIDRELRDDPVVHAEVRSLLEHESRAGSFLMEPVADRMPDLLGDEPLAQGTVVGAYAIIRELGRSGMGRVYLASDERLGRTVALKALAPQFTLDPLQRERLRREARAAAGLTHPGICTVYALEDVNGDLYIATEFVDGRTLRDEIQAGSPPSAEQVTQTALELAAALASAHARGITHRDLKPENIMRTRDGRLKVLDFGLARTDAVSLPEEWATTPGMLIGTPAYMAPEQLNGQPADPRSDVFAFGVVVYEYASGGHPFEAATPLAMVARVLESDALPLGSRTPQLSDGLADVIDRCLRKTPGSRFKSAAELVQALDRAADTAAPESRARWWSVHQAVMIAVYAVASALGWQLKEWLQTPVTVSLFIALGLMATIGGVLRAHMIFTEWTSPSMLTRERRLARRATVVVDMVMAVALIADAVLFGARPLTAVLTMALAVGIALAATVLEPATTRAAFGE